MKNYVVGASLGYYVEHIVPLAESFQRASRKVKKSVIGQHLQAHAHGLWGLLPAFCRCPTDTYQNFGPLAKLLITFIKKDSFIHKNIALALQELVNQNRSVLGSKQDAGESNTYAVKESILEFTNVPSYSKKTATRNIRTLASCSTELLLALTDLFFDSPPEKRSYLKDAIGCLASISDSLITKNIFMSSLERFQLINGVGEFEKLGSHAHASSDKEPANSSTKENAQRGVMIELASSLVEGAKEDLIDLIYDFIRQTLQATDEGGHREAYHALSRILEEHAWFCSSRLVELIDFLLGLKSPVDTASLRSRFASFHILLVHIVKGSVEEENTKAFLILNEIILRLKDSNEEARKAAYDMLLMMSSSLRNSSCVSLDAPYHKLISMIMGYFSGSSPHIKSGAVSALSVLVYKEADICLFIPDLVPSVLTLLQSKAVEVIKAVLGFMKVLVSCLQAKDLHNLLSDIVNGVLPWSSVSRNHFRSKVTIILEIMLRKCGSAAVKFVTPEKYKGFVKTILENRHGKTSSMEAGTIDMKPASTDSSHNWQQKSKHKDLGISSGENGSVEFRKRKREKKQFLRTNEPHLAGSSSGGGVNWVKNARHSNHGKPTEGRSQGNGKDKRIYFNKEPANDGKRKMERAKGGRNDKSAFHKPANASKLHKHQQVGRKRQKTNK
ncbi:hypothetical protein L1049_008185 [Liquidambar formosana]|uniref:RRP12-like protein n=1 Tax=Liquidambar formosana TaxID=63359 RepID=A0AAP0S3W4_LIQFO